MVKRTLRLLVAMLVVNGLLLSAQWWFPPVGTLPTWVALEAAFVAGAFLLLPQRRWALVCAGLVSMAIVIVGVLSFADAATRIILARPLNLYLDARLASSVADLLVGTLGSPLALLVELLALLAFAGAVFGLAYLLRPAATGEGEWDRAGSRSGLRRWGERAAGLALMAPLVLWLASPPTLAPPVGQLSARAGAPGVGLIGTQVERLRSTLAEKESFEAELAVRPVGNTENPGLLARLGGRDVILAFIESYGVSVLDDPQYSTVVEPRLEDFGRRMEAAGLSLVSGTLVAPTQGGQSWFSHGSLLSGLWLDNQLRYDLMLGSDRETLIDDFRRAGYRTVALMPAITFAWPEGEQFGYDEIFARPDIKYLGPPLNWVTMPDQFTWSFLEKNIRGGSGGSSPAALDRPVFLEVGLISSHAPWTPILPVLDDWSRIGDGEVFERWAGAGERPEDLWLDTERVREQFALSVDYAIAAMASYAENFVDGEVLLIALGDHQPAPLITGEGVSWEVPVHIVSGDPDLVKPFLDWGFQIGGIPARDHSDRGMDQFRGWFLRAYSDLADSGSEADDG